MSARDKTINVLYEINVLNILTTYNRFFKRRTISFNFNHTDNLSSQTYTVFSTNQTIALKIKDLICLWKFF